MYSSGISPAPRLHGSCGTQGPCVRLHFVGCTVSFAPPPRRVVLPWDLIKDFRTPEVCWAEVVVSRPRRGFATVALSNKPCPRPVDPYPNRNSTPLVSSRFWGALRSRLGVSRLSPLTDLWTRGATTATIATAEPGLRFWSSGVGRGARCPGRCPPAGSRREGRRPASTGPGGGFFGPQGRGLEENRQARGGTSDEGPRGEPLKVRVSIVLTPLVPQPVGEGRSSLLSVVSSGLTGTLVPDPPGGPCEQAEVGPRGLGTLAPRRPPRVRAEAGPREGPDASNPFQTAPNGTVAAYRVSSPTGPLRRS